MPHGREDGRQLLEAGPWYGVPGQVDLRERAAVFDHAGADAGGLHADHRRGDPVGAVPGAQGRGVFDAVQERYDEGVAQRGGWHPGEGGVQRGVLDGDQAGVHRFAQLGVRLHGGGEGTELRAADGDSGAAQGFGGAVLGQADHAVPGAGQQGGEEAADAAGAEHGHGVPFRHDVRHEVLPFDGRPRGSVAALGGIIAPHRRLRETGGMCRSIKTLRPPVLPDEATEEDIHAAALQYVRKVSGFRAPAAHNREVFDRAVAAVAEATAELLGGWRCAGSRPGAPRSGPVTCHQDNWAGHRRS